MLVVHFSDLGFSLTGFSDFGTMYVSDREGNYICKENLMEFLMECLKWIDRRMIAIATVVLVGITWRYVRLTRETLEENRQIRLDTQKPEIAITVSGIQAYQQSRSGFPTAIVSLCVENIGQGPATNVEFDIDCNFRVPGHESIRKTDFVEHGIGYLQPRDRKQCRFFSINPDGYDELIQTPLNIKMTYKDSLHKEYTVCRRINFREHEDELR